MYRVTMPGENLQDVISQLESVSELLGDHTIELLRAAVESGSGVRPPEEKAISQARRAIDKAVHLLSSLPPSND